MSGSDDILSGYGIGAVAKMTGLTDHTIRVWERRHAAVDVRRQANGRRVYSPEDVDRLLLLRQLTEQGVAISQVARLETDALREELRAVREAGPAPLPAELRVALLGDFLPTQFDRARRELKPLKVCVANSNPEQFAADIDHETVDFVVVECAVLDAQSIARLGELVTRTGARAGMLLFRFGKTEDIERARDKGLIVVRAPVDVDQVRSLLLRAASEGTTAAERVPPRLQSARDDAWPIPGSLPRRRFTPAQLARLARIDSPIDCECPQQLASLVSSLAAFEIYSAQCASRNDDDAALHRFLHHTTADARARIEEALARVIEFEALDV